MLRVSICFSVLSAPSPRPQWYLQKQLRNSFFLDPKHAEVPITVPLAWVIDGHVTQAKTNSLRIFFQVELREEGGDAGNDMSRNCNDHVSASSRMLGCDRSPVRLTHRKKERVHVEQGGFMFEDQASLILKAQTHTNLPAVCFEGLLCGLNSFEYLGSLWINAALKRWSSELVWLQLTR